ncbi:MAG: hypothetical protein HYX47_01065 [Burkholderiales bacterium]|nr:hypothetical protein [Burkholderiales bacterium]
MHNRMTSRPRQGNTVPAQGETRVQEKVPRLPHERDESADSQESVEPSGRRVGGQAREDVERGVVDTDRGPVLDGVYDKVREGTPDPVKKFSP